MSSPLSARPGPPLVQLAWRILRYSRSGELAWRLPRWTGLFAQVHAGPEGPEHLLVIIRYIIWVGGKRAHDAARRVLHSVLDAPAAEALMRSYGEELIEQGRQQGLARGREEGLTRGRAEYILRTLSARGVPLDDAARQRILSCTDVTTLDRWFDRSLNATSLSDVLDDLTQ